MHFSLQMIDSLLLADNEQELKAKIMFIERELKKVG